MSHVFISYSKLDHLYVSQLADSLLNAGFDVWVDTESLHSGSDWWDEIVAGIRTCAAIVVVMSPRSKASRWVQREVLLADEWGKTTFPLLLEGDNWPLFVDRQFEDVRDDDGRVDERLFASLTAAGVPRRLQSQPGRNITKTDKVAAVRELESDPQFQANLENPPPPDPGVQIQHMPPAEGSKRRRPPVQVIALLVVVALAAISVVISGGNDGENADDSATPTVEITDTPGPVVAVNETTPVSLEALNVWRVDNRYIDYDEDPTLNEIAAAHAADLGSRSANELEDGLIYTGSDGETAAQIAAQAGYRGAVEVFVVIQEGDEPVTLFRLIEEVNARGGPDVWADFRDAGIGMNNTAFPPRQFVVLFLGSGS